MSFELLHFYISPGHNFFGQHGKPARNYEIIEVTELHCLAGRGLKGDRFLDFKTDYKGQITFFEEEVHAKLCEQFAVHDKSPGAFRRNVITRRMDLNSLIGVEFEIQGVHFLGTEECKPCYWMNQAFHDGAEEAMKGHGGLRARILGDGILRLTAGVQEYQ